MIQRADKTAFDIQFYVYVDNEIRKLPSDSLKRFINGIIREEIIFPSAIWQRFIKNMD